MLAKITSDLGEVVTVQMWETDSSQALNRLAGYPFQADFKYLHFTFHSPNYSRYDGCRAQIHRKGDGFVHIFSRHLENITSRYPG